MPPITDNKAAIENAPKGSVFFNNTTYSGADIKVVVTLYDKGNYANENIEQLTEQMNELEASIESTEGRLAQLDNRLVAVKQSSNEDFQLRVQRVDLVNSINSNRSALLRMQERIKTLSLGSKGGVSTKVLAELQTISISTHREKHGVRAFGHTYPKSFTRGQRMIAGSMIFTVFDEHVFWELMEAAPSDFDSNVNSPAILDQMPPMDILISFANESGSVSRMTLFGVEFLNEGHTMSIEDLVTENVVQYVARDIDVMRSVSSRYELVDDLTAQINASKPTRASDLILEDEYQNLKNSLDPFSRQRRRRNPFL